MLKKIGFSFIVICCMMLGGFFLFDTYIEDHNSAEVANVQHENTTKELIIEEPEPEPEEIFTDIRVAATGDIMFHGPQINSGFDHRTQTYDFKSVFEDVKPILNEADLVIANFETTLGGPERGYSGYPLFSAPDEVIDGIKYAGIDVLTTANNHSLDTGRDGLKRTVKIIREKGLDSVGTYEEESDSKVLLKDVDGIQIGILSYTESTNGLGSQYNTEELHNMVNMVEENRMIQDIHDAKALGAEFIITFMHWGDEYMVEPNNRQVELAHMMAEEGVDLILGSHPHVIQKTDVIETDDSETFVVYSMGNFVSNQRKETLGDHRHLTEDGVIINFDIRKDEQTNDVTIENVEYVPTWVYRNKESGQSTYTYRILPIEHFLLTNEISDSYKQRMERSFDATVSKMAENYLQEY